MRQRPRGLWKLSLFLQVLFFPPSDCLRILQRLARQNPTTKGQPFKTHFTCSLLMYDYIDFKHDFSLWFFYLSLIWVFKEKKIINKEWERRQKFKCHCPVKIAKMEILSPTRLNHLQCVLSQSLELVCV